MKATQYRNAAAAGILLLSVAGAPLFAQQQPAQRGGPPGAETPHILITAFSTDSRKLAVEAADELRKRVQAEHSAKELYAVPKTQINATLESSGFPVDSALGESDLMVLSKSMRGDYVIEGKASKSGAGDGVRLETRILLQTGPNTLVQPLPPADGKDIGDAAKIVERSIADALKGMPNYKDCINDLRGQKFEQAVKDARLGLQAYSNSVLSRICLLQAQTALKASPDSIIANANAILATDSTSLLALANLVDAYKAKGDKDNAVRTNLAIAHLNSANPAIVLPIVDDVYNLGAPEKTLDLIDALIKADPADATLLKKKWTLLLALASKGSPGMYKQAIATGEDLVKLDSASATLEYFQRQIGAAQSDTNSAKIQELNSAAAQKFPKEISFQLILAKSYLAQNKTQQGLESARRALAIDPKNVAAAQYVLFSLNQLGQTDSIIPAAQQMIAGGIAKDSIASSLLGAVGPALKKAQETKERADWEAALKAAETVDAIAPSQKTAFYIGVSSFQIAADLLTHVQTLVKGTPKAADKAQACAEAKQAEDVLVKTSTAMPRGGKEDPTAAGQILTNVGQFGDFITSVKKAFCK